MRYILNIVLDKKKHEKNNNKVEMNIYFDDHQEFQWHKQNNDEVLVSILNEELLILHIVSLHLLFHN